MEFVKRRIYLTLERGRDICLRNLLRKVYLAGDLDEEGKRNTRIYVRDFAAAIRLGEAQGGPTDGVDGMDVDGGVGGASSSAGENNDEVECLVANMIYKVSKKHTQHFTFLSLSPHNQNQSIALSLLTQTQTILTFAGCCGGGAEPDERLHLPRTRHRRPLQDRRLPRHRHLSCSALLLFLASDIHIHPSISTTRAELPCRVDQQILPPMSKAKRHDPFATWIKTTRASRQQGIHPTPPHPSRPWRQRIPSLTAAPAYLA